MGWDELQNVGAGEIVRDRKWRGFRVGVWSLDGRKALTGAPTPPPFPVCGKASALFPCCSIQSVKYTTLRAVQRGHASRSDNSLFRIVSGARFMGYIPKRVW